ncbi:NUDIX hydrolase [Luteithermobacter gelatinilyticus]|uniref:NUDIX hydrolase n=1 Tax=Luteithermobacter gelatinilyticus TaxID=2582913 RepID=UPI001105CA16|nr:NUDIX hydrolase [Luteithermobacter gelatinilyticus]
MKREYPDRPIVAVGTVVFRQDEVLLIRRRKPPKKDRWSIPGGAQNLGESLHQTAAREVLEETSIRVKDLELLDVLDLIDPDESGAIRHHYSLIDFVGLYAGGDIVPGDDAIDARWVPLGDLSDYGLWSATEKMILKGYRRKYPDGKLRF